MGPGTQGLAAGASVASERAARTADWGLQRGDAGCPSVPEEALHATPLRVLCCYCYPFTNHVFSLNSSSYSLPFCVSVRRLSVSPCRWRNLVSRVPNQKRPQRAISPRGRPKTSRWCWAGPPRKRARRAPALPRLLTRSRAQR